MNRALALRSADPDFYPNADVRLHLLIEMEPGYRIFFRNLFDLVLARNEPPLFLASRPVILTKDLYIRTGIQPRVVLKSLAWHLALVPLLLALWTWSSKWEHQPYALRRARNLSHAQFSYRKPLESFPAHEGRQGRRIIPERTAVSRQRVLHLRAERRQAVISPPPIKIRGGEANRIASFKQELPAPGLMAMARPDLNQFSQRRLASPGQSVVAPPPQTGGLHHGEGIKVPFGFPDRVPINVIAPAASLQGSIGARGRGDIEIGPSVVVAPPPRLPMHEQRAGWGVAHGVLGGSGSEVVPPPPSIASAVSSSNGGGTSIIGLEIISPPPSAGHSSNRIGAGGNILAGPGVQVVPPPPSAAHSSNLAGAGRSALAGAEIQVVAPPPIISHSEGLGSRGGNALAGMEAQALPAQRLGRREDGIAGNSADGSGADPESSSDAVKGVVPSSDPAATKITPLEQQPAAMVRAAIPPPVVDDPGGATRTLPLRVIQLALALPRTSYFTNYEAYLAERSVNEHDTQLIKLVYIFLPYQRGLTEYGVSTSKKFRLRVTRDPSCDESLLNMTWREAEQTLGQSPALNAESDKNKLPCYRTTADDYRKALERAR